MRRKRESENRNGKIFKVKIECRRQKKNDYKKETGDRRKK